MWIRTTRNEWPTGDFHLDENIGPKARAYLEKEAIVAERVRDALWQGADDEAEVLPLTLPPSIVR